MIPISLSKGSSYGGVNFLAFAVLQVSKMFCMKKFMMNLHHFFEDKIYI